MSISQNIFCRVKLISQYLAVARRDPSLSDSLQITEPVTVLYYPPRRPVPSVHCTVQCVQCTVQSHWTEDDLWQKTTFDGRRPLTEDDLWRKTTLNGRRPLTEDHLWWKTTFDERRPLTEDDLWWKTTDHTRAPQLLFGYRTCWSLLAWPSCLPGI